MNHRVEAGQVWEGMDGWIVVVVEADEPRDGDRWLVHKIHTIVAPDGVSPAICPTTVAEDRRRGGMFQSGWKRLF